MEPITSFAEGTRSEDITYGGVPLSPGARYYWRIRFFDTQTNANAWSVAGTAWFLLIQDQDGDGMADDFEQQIIDADPGDAFNTLDDVLPGDDFDSDGFSNLDEYLGSTDPTDPTNALDIYYGLEDQAANPTLIFTHNLTDLAEGKHLYLGKGWIDTNVVLDLTRPPLPTYYGLITASNPSATVTFGGYSYDDSVFSSAVKVPFGIGRIRSVGSMSRE